MSCWLSKLKHHLSFESKLGWSEVIALVALAVSFYALYQSHAQFKVKQETEKPRVVINSIPATYKFGTHQGFLFIHYPIGIANFGESAVSLLDISPQTRDLNSYFLYEKSCWLLDGKLKRPSEGVMKEAFELREKNLLDPTRLMFRFAPGEKKPFVLVQMIKISDLKKDGPHSNEEVPMVMKFSDGTEETIVLPISKLAASLIARYKDRNSPSGDNQTTK